MKNNLEKFCKLIQYQFKDISLLELALSHRSANGQSNERLEFLGDSILNFVIAAAIYEKFPKATEGDMSRLRASLVKGETLAILAREFSVGEYLRLGSGELKSGGMKRASILADSIEAIIGAIYLDGGFKASSDCVLLWYQQRLQNVDNISDLKDPKSQLQEYLQAKQLDLPTYNILNITGEAHQQVFSVECRVEQLGIVATGEATNRRKAEQAAAKALLNQLNQELG